VLTTIASYNLISANLDRTLKNTPSAAGCARASTVLANMRRWPTDDYGDTDSTMPEGGRRELRLAQAP
jgi:hypothetical protein